MSTNNSTICPRCTNIALQGLNFYALENLGYMISSECPGCFFFVEVALKHNIDVAAELQTQILLARPSKDGNLVYAYYVRNSDGNLNIKMAHKLRLCASFGYEIPFSADFEGLDDRYLGRRLAAEPDSAERFHLVKSWFERCTRSHGPACALPANLKLCITQGMSGHYVALSYSWGNGNSFKTTSQSIDRLESGFRTAELPSTLKDAVDVAHKMGFEWIWIDQLCILQGDLEDWSRESSRMAQVYSNSAFTICADLASSTNDGLFEERTILQSHSFGSNDAMCLQTLCQPWNTMTGHPLYRRGWAFQERILSVRNLHFFRDQIAWECNTTLYVEESRGRQSKPEGHFAKQMFTDYYHLKMGPNSNLTDIDLVHRIGKWNSILQEMSVRVLSFRSDKLPAISGLATALQIPDLGEYLAGVWSYNPFISMAWFSRSPQQLPEDYYSPSWSCAWTAGQIVWYYDTWRGGDDMPSSVAMIDWKLWDNQFGPRLLHHNVIHKNYDPKGEVLEGSSLTIAGHCRRIYVADVPGAKFDHNFGEVGAATGETNKPGHRICMDTSVRNCDAVCSFAASFPNVNRAYDCGSVREYLAVQIVRERKERWQRPKIIGLVLVRAPEYGEGAFRRVGLTDFDEPLGGEWARYTLGLV
ncbi:HET-domain-containing protein [Phaeosphaeriaceae sp. SRC1lsM3a]|nr:HET-domain-containing protein [Stagonospora sp. SRC1lsM3a]